MKKCWKSSLLMLAASWLSFAVHAQQLVAKTTPKASPEAMAVAATPNSTDDAPWVILGGISRHSCRDCGFRESNPGLAVQWKSKWLNDYMDSNDWRLTTGAYINSNNRNSLYVGVLWLPIDYGMVKAGLQGAVISNYLKQSITPTLLPTISIETAHVGADIFLVPKFPSVSSAVLLSFKVRY